MGMFDGLRKAVGLSTDDGRQDVAEHRAEMRTSKDPADAFAVAIADKVVGYGADQTARILPELAQSGVKWSPDADKRWSDIARTAKGIATDVTRTPLQSIDRDLAPTVDAGALAHAAQSYNGRGMISRHAADTRVQLGDKVRSVLVAGAGAERTAYEHAASMGAKRDFALESTLARTTGEHVTQARSPDAKTHMQWLLDSNRAFLAMARTGLVGGDEIVDYARATSTYGNPAAVKGQVASRTSPVRADTPEARMAIVDREVNRSIDAVNTDARRPVAPPFRPEIEAKPVAEAAPVQAHVPRETVGERANREIGEALASRLRMQKDWHAPEGSVIGRRFLENGSTNDLQAARMGHLPMIEDKAFRAEMERIGRHSTERHVAPAISVDIKPAVAKDPATVAKDPATTAKTTASRVQMMAHASMQGRTR